MKIIGRNTDKPYRTKHGTQKMINRERAIIVIIIVLTIRRVEHILIFAFEKRSR